MRLSNDSKKIFKIVTEFKSELRIKSQILNPLSKGLIMTLINNFDDAMRVVNYFEKNNNSNKITEYKIVKIVKQNDIIFPQNLLSILIPEVILKSIYKTSKCYIYFDFLLMGRKIDIYFILGDSFNNVDRTLYVKHVEKIILWLIILHNHSRQICSSNLKLYIYMTVFKKEMPGHKNIVVSTDHINSAYTSSCPSNGEIVIFRSEEWFKVLIHESFHAFGLDFSGMNNDLCNHMMLKIFKIKSDIKLYETYTELWAELINVTFYVCLKNKKETNTKKIKLIEEYLNDEILFTYYQTSKLLTHMGTSYDKLYANNRCVEYKEDTNVFSYFISKMILYNNINDTLKWMINNNTNLLQFSQKEPSIVGFCELIRKNYKNKSISVILNKIDKYIEKQKNNFGKRTSRMSVLEFEN